VTGRRGRLTRAAAALGALGLLGASGAAARGDADRGRALYAERCALCHGVQGEGWDWSKKVAAPPVPVPDLAQAAPTRSDEFLFEIVKDGGEAVGRTRFMPPFGFQLSDQEVWDLVAYVRSLETKPR
jgi:mono/diheme cytochrome c family protein